MVGDRLACGVFPVRPVAGGDGGERRAGVLRALPRTGLRGGGRGLRRDRHDGPVDPQSRGGHRREKQVMTSDRQTT